MVIRVTDVFPELEPLSVGMSQLQDFPCRFKGVSS